MPLIPLALADALEQQWLASDSAGQNPSSVAESGDRFAGAVAQWFSQALAAGFPCATASARRPQLASEAAVALASPTAEVAGARLGAAVALYMSGQLFGAGVAGAPIATAAAVAAFAAVFADLDAAPRDRALQLGLGCWGLALSTLVTFPPPLPPAPVT